MPIGLLGAAAIGGGATLLSGLFGASSAKSAAKTQAKATMAGIEEQRRQYDNMQALLSPYVSAGTGALSSMSALSGASGADAQAKAIAAIEGGEEYKSLTAQGENAILQNAAATGGLRGGNIQGALAQFRPALLSSLINQKYSQYSGLAQMGQASAAGVGSAGLQTGTNIAQLLQQQGAAQAGGQMATAQALQAFPNAVMSGLGLYAGLGGTF